MPLAAAVFALQIYTALLLGRCWVLAEDIDPSIVEKSRYSETVVGASAGNTVALTNACVCLCPGTRTPRWPT